MQEQTFTINGTPHEVRFSMKATKLFEELTGKSITESTGTYDDFLFFFTTLQALNPHFKMTVDQFDQYISQNTDLFIQWQTANATTPPETLEPPSQPLKKNNLSVLWMLSLYALAFMAAAPIIFGIGLLPMSCWGIIKLIIWLGSKLMRWLRPLPAKA